MKLRKVLALGLTVACWMGSVQGVMAADSYGVGSASYEDNGKGYISVNTPKESAISLEAESELFGNGDTTTIPAAYDSRTVMNNGTSIISPVRDQGIYGSCWAFSTCSAAETSLLMKGLLDKDTQFSPLQLAYFTYNTRNNPLNISLLDRTYLTSSNFLDIGGNEHLAAFSLANWAGLVDEAKTPYENADTVLTSGLKSKYAFAEDSAHLENAKWLTLNDFANVKQMIMKYGSGTIGYYMDEYPESKCYNATTGAYYLWEDFCFDAEYGFTTNHQVTIVGWDDNYSKSNFAVEPAGDGAWLVKNSWGSEWGNDGYFWLSYYDKSIYAEDELYSYGGDIVFWDFDSTNNYDNNYYYDGGSSINWFYSWNTETGDPNHNATMANVFTAQYDETIEAVSFFTYQDNIAYTIKVYTDVPEDKVPEEGTLASTVSGTADFYGYHTVELTDCPVVSKNKNFVIVVELDTQVEGTYVYLPIDMSDSWEWGVNFEANAKLGESLYKDSEYGWTYATMDDEPFNYRIKAFTSTSYGDDLGDMNFDGAVNAGDALCMLKVAASMNELSEKMFQNGDVNKNGDVNAEDALLVLKKVANMITDF